MEPLNHAVDACRCQLQSIQHGGLKPIGAAVFKIDPIGFCQRRALGLDGGSDGLA